MILAYIRISTSKQDVDTQKLQIFEYCKLNKMVIDEFVEVEQSSRKNEEHRKINLLKDKLKKGDILISVELSRLGRSMLEVMNLVVSLSEKGVKFIFLRQPQMSSFCNPYAKLLLAFYGFMAETERDFISQRTKAGLDRAKANGVVLGRPFGSFNSMHDGDIEQIKDLLKRELGLTSIWKFLGKKGSFQNFYAFCRSRKLIIMKGRYNDSG